MKSFAIDQNAVKVEADEIIGVPMHVVKFTLLLLFLVGCSKKSEGEYIYRKASDELFTAKNFPVNQRERYPWERDELEHFPRITKEFFRCKGNPLNPVREKRREGKESFYFHDCNGQHSLPIVDDKEFIYPILIDLLNFVQKRLDHRVVITTGHRCPTHNSYSDFSSYNYGSKHMVGAEVDFYVEGCDPQTVIDCLQSYYDQPFQRYCKSNLNVKSEPWYNEEIFIKLYEADEGRDEDNQHSYPYLSIQVRFDRAKKERVRFDQKISESLLRG